MSNGSTEKIEKNQTRNKNKHSGVSNFHINYTNMFLFTVFNSSAAIAL